jgi:endonuclease III-like uncharacterized protein
MGKFKEIWIKIYPFKIKRYPFKEDSGKYEFDVADVFYEPKKECEHLIEYTAYQELVRSNEELKRELDGEKEANDIRIGNLLRLIRANSENWGDELDRLRKKKIEDFHKIESLEKNLALAVEALKFYADKTSYGESRLCGGPEEPDVEFIHDVAEDEGSYARETLKKLEGDSDE